jgi:Ca2+/H+ antiporter, TMEM165/GDT1 family
MEALWLSTLTVAVAEIGDKTQLLAILLAVRFGRPVPIILGILVATILNHAAAAWLGTLVAGLVGGPAFQIGLGLAFLAMAAWALVPDEQTEAGAVNMGGVFLTTTIAFFLVEIGDKTQVATVLLAARFSDVLLVTIGTTLGMMLANVPAVLLGEAVTRVVPLGTVRWIAAGILALTGIWVLLAVTGLLPRLM